MSQPTPITAEQLEAFSEHYNADPVRKLATTALSKSDMSDVAYVSAGASQMRHKFSIEIPTLAVTNQKKSGRCWLFSYVKRLQRKRDLLLSNCPKATPLSGISLNGPISFLKPSSKP